MWRLPGLHNSGDNLLPAPSSEHTIHNDPEPFFPLQTTNDFRGKISVNCCFMSGFTLQITVT